MIIAFSTLLVLLVAYPDKYLDAVAEGLEIYVGSVMTGLFPFLMLTGLLTALGVGNVLSRLLEKPTKHLFGAPPIGGYIFAVSLLSGYPIGAKTVSDFYDIGIVDKSEARSVSAFASTSGPLFVLGTIGVKMFGDYKVGLIVLVAHIAATVLNGMIFKNFNVSAGDKAVLPKVSEFDGRAFNAVLEGAISAVFRVGACMAFFNMIIVALTDSGIISAVGKAFEFMGIASGGMGAGFASGLIEVTKGVHLIAASGATPREAVPVVSLLVSFGGCSIALQSMTFLSSTGIKLGYYLCTKISQGILAYALATLVAIAFL